MQASPVGTNPVKDVLARDFLSAPDATETTVAVRVLGDLSFRDSSLYPRLRQGVTVVGSVRFGNFASPSELPNNWTVLKSVHARACDLLHFPSGWAIGVNLNISESRKVQLIAGTIFGDLNASGCSALVDISAADVGGDINLQGCTALEKLPEWIFALGAKNGAEMRVVRLQGTGISDADKDRLRALDFRGVQYHLDNNEVVPATSS